MKQMLFVMGLICIGFFGAFAAPFWALVPYYMFTILQPQFLWEWALPSGVRWSLFAAAIAVLGVAIHSGSLIQRRRWPVTASLILAYSTLVLISSLSAYDLATATMWSSIIFKITFMAVITILVIHQLKHVAIFGAAITVAMGILGWQFNSLYFFEGRMDILNKGLGSYDNNGTGLLLAMGVPFAYAFAVAGTRRWQRFAAAGVGLLLIHAVLLSYSRGAMLAGLLGLIWLVFHHRPRKQALALAVTLTIVLAYMAGAEVRTEFKSITDYEDDYSARSRLDSWGAAWQMIAEHPLTGVGVRNSNIYSYNYGADKQGRTIHNLYLQTAADSGIPTLLVLIAIYFIMLRNLHIARAHIGEYLANPPPEGEDGTPGKLAQMKIETVTLAERIVLAMQTSAIIFLCGGTFLSLETFELSWLLVALSADLPYLVKRQLEAPETQRVHMKRKVRKPQLAKYTGPQQHIPTPG